MNLRIKSNQKQALIIFALCLSLIASGMIGAAIAKYISTINGTSNAGVAVWSIEVNDQQIASPEAQTFTFDLFDTLYEEDCTTPELHVSPGVIAPGTGGSFTLKVENLSQVDAELNMVLTEQNENSIPIQYSTDRSTWHDDLLFLQHLFTDFFLQRETGIATQTVYWRWCYTGSGTAHAGQADSGDTALGYLALNGEVTLGILADVTAAQYLPRPDAPAQDLLASEEITETSITLKAIDGAEYSMDGSTWQDDPTFTDLVRDTEYTFYARYKETSVSGASESSMIILSTDAIYVDFELAYDNSHKIGYESYVTTDLVIPETFYDTEDDVWYRVTSIGDGVFFEHDRLISVSIPESVTSIRDMAFAYCYKLESVPLPSGLLSIGEQAFIECYELVDIDIPNSVTTIEQQAFFGCTGLESITIPDGVTAIGNNTFSNCRSLTNLTISDNVSSIDYHAFSYCSSLTSVKLPANLSSISQHTFNSCIGLTSIIIPAGITSIGDYAFRDCTSLTDVYFMGSQEDWNAITIGKSNDALTAATIHYNYAEE